MNLSSYTVTCISRKLVPVHLWREWKRGPLTKERETCRIHANLAKFAPRKKATKACVNCFECVRRPNKNSNLGTSKGLSLEIDPMLRGIFNYSNRRSVSTKSGSSIMEAFGSSIDMDIAANIIVPIVGVAALSFVAAFVGAGLSLALQPFWVVRWAQKYWSNVIFYKPMREPIVALTIDDGPHKDITPELLEILKENDCRATWFIIGNNMDKCPDLVARIHSEGHEVGNHTMYDVPSWRLPWEELKKQLLEVDNRLEDYYFKDADGRAIKWFRPGHGFFTKRMLDIVESHGYRTALGSLFPLDTLFKSQGMKIAKYLLWKIRAGSIIILHDRGPQKLQTAEAFSWDCLGSTCQCKKDILHLVER